MSPKVKNILIFAVVAVAITLAFIYFSGDDVPEADLVSEYDSLVPAGMPNGTLTASDDFLSLLLSVRNITLDDSIFSQTTFKNLRDSSVILVPDGNEGRPNPFAPIGVDLAQAPISGGEVADPMIETALEGGEQAEAPTQSSPPASSSSPAAGEGRSLSGEADTGSGIDAGLADIDTDLNALTQELGE